MYLIYTDTAEGIANDLLSAGLVDARNMIASKESQVHVRVRCVRAFNVCMLRCSSEDELLLFALLAHSQLQIILQKL